MRQIRHGVGLSAASGAISQDAHSLGPEKGRPVTPSGVIKHGVLENTYGNS